MLIKFLTKEQFFVIVMGSRGIVKGARHPHIHVVNLLKKVLYIYNLIKNVGSKSTSCLELHLSELKTLSYIIFLDKNVKYFTCFPTYS